MTMMNASELLETLPDKVGGEGAALLPTPKTIPGTMVVWITANPLEMTNALRNGYHLPKRGDEYLLDDQLFHETPEGYLVYGDAIPAIVRTEAWHAKLQRDRSAFMRTLTDAESPAVGPGQLVLSNNPITNKE